MIVERADDIPKKLVDCAERQSCHAYCDRAFPGARRREAEIHEKLRKKLPNVELKIV